MERIQIGNIVILGIVFLVMITAIWLYNSLIRKRNNINNAYSSIDALLKKRFDLIPNLVATVRQYMDYEKGLLNQLTELRAKAILGNLSFEEKERLAAETGKVIKGLIVAAENYPDLKASQNFLQLQAALNEVEEQLSAARRALSAHITEYNNAIKTFPSNLIAKLMGYQAVQWFEIPEGERTKPDIEKLFKT